MGNKFNKFLLLMWKNFVLLRRRPIATAFEIIIPVLLALILVAVRGLIKFDTKHSALYGEFSDYENIRNYTYCKTQDVINYYPNNPIITTVVEQIKMPDCNFTYRGFNSREEMERSSMEDVITAIEFNGVKDNELPDSLSVTLRFHSDDAEGNQHDWFTNFLFPAFQLPGPRRGDDDSRGGPPNYAGRGFLFFQVAITEAVLKTKTHNENFDFPTVSLQRFPYPQYNDDPFFNTAMESVISLLIIISVMYNFINTVRAITTEKEKQLKESMKIMGLPGWLHWVAWFVRAFTILLVAVILIVIVLKVDFKIAPVFRKTEGFLLFIFLLIYACSTITFSFLISVFFSKANTAAAVGSLVFFISYLPYTLMQQQYDSLSLGSKLAASLLANTGVSYGLSVILKFEAVEAGAQWGNLFDSVSPDDDLTFGGIILMLILDTFLYLILALYVEAVFPGDFGVPQPWYFPFTRKYWCNEDVNTDDVDGEIVNEGDKFEESSNNLHSGIHIKSLGKKFGVHDAVKSLNLKMYEGQITVLLGHNGAGKTTTMSMLTGMFPPTSGTAIVNGHDIRTNIQSVRDSMGLCLQHNVLFDNLTVREHLYFFGKLKGLNNEEVNYEIDNYIKLLELEDKRDARSSTLSGGMKRKLSVGMALCGKSKVVMLDEPTAGMDPSARRTIWDILQKQKHDRTILLTTHFMDEADLLGDRIAIMSAGTLQCCGSSFFLKKKYGAGYYLIMDISPKCNPNDITKLIRKHIPGIKIESHVGSELTYLLAESESSKFEGMLFELEHNIHRLHIQSYGVSLTTLEEVFMKVGADHDQTLDKHEYNNNEIQIKMPEKQQGLLSGYPLYQNQFIGMAMKKFLSTWRSWFLFLLQIFLPIVLLIIAVLTARANSPSTTFKALDINLNSYPSPVTLISTTDVNDEYFTAYKELLSGQKQQTSTVDDINSTILELTTNEPAVVKKNYIVGASFIYNGTTTNLKGWFNGDPYHSTPLTLGLLLNTLLKTSPASNQTIHFVNHPLPLSPKTQANQLVFNIMGYQIALQLGFGMAFVGSFYVLFCIKERISKSKHLQFVSGVNVFIFWGVSLLCDLITFVITIVGIIITMAALQEDGFKTSEEIGRLTFILFFYGCSILPLLYLSSYLFAIPSTGFSRVMLIGAITGMVGVTVMQVLEIEDLDLLYVARPLHWVLLFIPFYSVTKATYDVSTIYSTRDICNKFIDTLVQGGLNHDQAAAGACAAQSVCCNLNVGYYDWQAPGIARNVFAAYLGMIICWILIIVNEFGLFSYLMMKIMKYEKPPVPEQEIDADVKKENDRIHYTPENKLHDDNILVLKDMTKYYKNFLAVNGLCLGVKTKECFGLLGVNGAGKTSTFKMMTGDEHISYGEAWVSGISIKKNQKQVQKLIGYCPQFDALLDDLTARETLTMFGLIRGVPFKECKAMGESLAVDFDFFKHLDKKTKELSGGNKRKLSTAIALIGDPPVIYLDEPTTGMDPATKRFLWQALCKLRDRGKCIILTSHSMEECEALCTRLAIMVNGTFRCLGSTQRLKNKFAQGYTLTIKLKKHQDSEVDTTVIENFVRTKFSGAILREKHEELLSYQLVDNDLPWSRMFGILEKSKKELDIGDYSLGQCSLEQVFLSFTKHQR